MFTLLLAPRRILLVVIAAVASAALTTPARSAPVMRSGGCPPALKPPQEKPVLRPRWLSDMLITEYFPAPERWFHGRTVRAPGLSGRHRIDWLYSARGLAMQGEGIGADGRPYHFAGPYSLTWRNANGGLTYPASARPGTGRTAPRPGSALPGSTGPVESPTRSPAAGGRTARRHACSPAPRRRGSRPAHPSASPTGTTSRSTPG